MRHIIKYFLFPVLFYFFFFCLLTFPSILSFSHNFFADEVDGLQNVWNIWWVNKAVTVLHQTPWKTVYLHFPYGTTLLGHTLNPFNGLVGSMLIPYLPLNQVYNSIVIFTFVVGGVTMFLLAFYLTRSYIASLLSGYIFTFSNYHFAHAAGHLQLLSLEWIPLFVLSWIVFLRKPRLIMALTSILLLYFLILCDYYYFFYSVLFGLFYFVYVIRNTNLTLWLKRNIFPFLIFIGGALIMAGPIILSLFVANVKDPFIGEHPAVIFSNDLLGFLIPGGNWRFAPLTQIYWSHLPGNIDEKSVHLGITVLLILLFLWIERRKKIVPDFKFWLFCGGFFYILSLGPILQIGGLNTHLPLPYFILAKLFPPLELSGMPVRMMVMVIFIAAVLFAYGIKELIFQNKKIIVGIIFIVLFFEYLPINFVTAEYKVPQYVYALADLPYGAVMVNISTAPGKLLYYQTIYDKPMAFGYISRIPASVLRNDIILGSILTKQDYIGLCEFNFRYLVTGINEKDLDSFSTLGKPVYEEKNIQIFDMLNVCQKAKLKK